MKRAKKWFTMALVFFLVFSTMSGYVFAESSSQSTFEEVVLMDTEVMKMTVTDYVPEELSFEIFIENKTDRSLMVEMDEAVVNGIMCSPYWVDTVPASAAAYSDLYWFEEDLEAVGINYLQDIRGTIEIYEEETYDLVGEQEVSWSVDVGDTDLPPVEELVFESMEPLNVIATDDFTLQAVDFNTTGDMDLPTLTFYMENHTDSDVYISMEDVLVNGIVCDPYWSIKLRSDCASYDSCIWYEEDLEDSHIDPEAIEKISFTMMVSDWDSNENILSVDASIDVTAGTIEVEQEDKATASAKGDQSSSITKPDDSTSEDGDTDGDKVLDSPEEVWPTQDMMGRIDNGRYENTYFGFSFQPKEDWTMQTEEDLVGMEENIVDLASSNNGLIKVGLMIYNEPELGEIISLQDFLKLTASMTEEEELAESMGLDSASMEIGTTELGGQAFDSINVTGTSVIDDIEFPLTARMIYIQKEDNVMEIAIAIFGREDLDSLEGMFSVLSETAEEDVVMNAEEENGNR